MKISKIRKEKSPIKKVFKNLTLISLKEAYLFLRNFYGLVFHPFKTTVNILQKPDWSQTFLVFGFPAYFGALFLVFFVPTYLLFHHSVFARPILHLLFYSLVLLLFFIGLYLFYWLGLYFYKCKLKQRN